MPITIKRTDYFGQVFNRQNFQTITGYCSDKNKEPKKSSVLFIVKNGGQSSVNSITHFLSILSKTNITARVLFCDEGFSSSGISYRIKKLLKPEDRLYCLDDSLVHVLNGPISDIAKRSFAVNKWLECNLLDTETVLSIDCIDEIFYALESKASGVAFSQNKFLLTTKTCSNLEKIRSAKPLLKPADLNLVYMQNRVFENIDLLISESEFFLNWLVENVEGIKQSEILNDLLPLDSKLLHLNEDTSDLRTCDLVFFLNDNTLNDCLIFLESLKRLDPKKLKKGFVISIAFYGSRLPKQIKNAVKTIDSIINSEIRLDQINDKEEFSFCSAKTKFIVPCFEEFNTYAFLELAKISSVLSDNHIINSDREWKVFNHQPEKVAEYLSHFLKAPTTQHAKNIDYDLVNNDWINLLSNNVSIEPNQELITNNPLVSICVAHFNRGEMLLGAIESINKQDYSNIEIIIVDDGSTNFTATTILDELEQQKHSQWKVTVIRQKNSYLGASRNAGVAASEGEYILFMDDDNEAKPNEVSTFVKASLNSQADIYTCFSEVFEGEGSPDISNKKMPTALYLGASLATAPFSNPFGDSNMFVRRSAILELEGFSEFYKVGRDDQEFLYRASLNGYRVQLIPKALYWYRISKTRMRQGHFNQYASFARVGQNLMQFKNKDQGLALRHLQAQSFVCGPWGVTDKNSAFKNMLTELARNLVLKYPKLYGVLKSIRGRL